MSDVQDDFEDPAFTLEGTGEVLESSNIEEIETSPKLSISKKAAKKRDARRRIEDYLELKRVKEVIEDYEDASIELEAWHLYDDNANNDAHVDKSE
jgi:hypothetical protein